ncbi:MAG: tRNA guanosine(34) transglycosylase Tgt [Deltaproteobacteria bacterium]|nr:tRNA guanosine(34) transglycosylase Tgt [Deltaproteobacteria bacterium]MBM4317126.1 tRNA guanosine(34) transglycosylase Tgt [Deltaproteobacteria bacterium]
MNNNSSHFEVLKSDGFARRGRLILHHGTLETPVFMPVGTVGAVKTMSPTDLKNVGSQIILGNTYHLYLRPGLESLKIFGGLHSFMNWDKPILTDSGGFQVFSLGKLKKLTDEGVQFQSHLNGDTLFLTPELSAQIQQTIGSDIAMLFDECVALPNTEKVLKEAVHRSLRWGKRFFEVPRHPYQKIFGIIQGGTSIPLRLESLEGTLQLPIDGLAVGGLSVGEPHAEMIHVLTEIAPHLPQHLPHYLMGVGTPRDILEAVKNGIDMFDCVLPTRNARNGGFFTHDGLLNIRNSVHTHDQRPIDATCLCECCQNYSRGYLRHLFLTKEILGLRLATLHNLYYYHRLMSQIRESLESGTFQSFYETMKPRLTTAYPDKTERALQDNIKSGQST